MWDKRLKLNYNWTGEVNSFVEHELVCGHYTPALVLITAFLHESFIKSDIQRVVFMMGGKCMLTVDSVMYFVH
jgi:hypothetical protein